MSEKRAIYGVNSSVLNDLPEPVQVALHLIGKNPSDDASLVLLQVVASIVHPDYLCNLASLGALPAEHREVALDLVRCCLSGDLSLDEQSAVLRFVEPIMMDR